MSRGTPISADLHRYSLGEDRFRPVPFREFAAAPVGRVVPVVAEVLGHLRIQSEDILGELIEQPVRAHQLHAVLLGLCQKLLGQLFLIHLGRHGIQCFGHDRSFSPSSARRVEPRPNQPFI